MFRYHVFQAIVIQILDKRSIEKFDIQAIVRASSIAKVWYSFGQSSIDLIFKLLFWRLQKFDLIFKLLFGRLQKFDIHEANIGQKFNWKVWYSSYCEANIGHVMWDKFHQYVPKFLSFFWWTKFQSSIEKRSSIEKFDIQAIVRQILAM